MRQNRTRSSVYLEIAHAESKAAICAAPANLIEGRKVIAIAHRLSTLKDFDRIVVFDDGRICQDSSPEMLIHN